VVNERKLFIKLIPLKILLYGTASKSQKNKYGIASINDYSNIILNCQTIISKNFFILQNKNRGFYTPAHFDSSFWFLIAAHHVVIH